MLLASLIAISFASSSTSQPADPNLLALRESETLTVEVQFTPELRSSALVSRLSVFAADAKIVAHEKTGPRELPIPDTQFFMVLGTDKAHRAMLMIEPSDPKSVRGFGFVGGQNYRLSGDADQLNKLRAEPMKAPADFNPLDSCGVIDKPVPFSAIEAVLANAVTRAPGSRKARLAVETDNEFMSVKFANNNTNASNWIAALVAAMNTQSFEADLDLTMELGLISLRPSTTTDPYSQNSNGAANSVELTEFGNVWQANFSGTQRAFAMLMSGKSTSNNSASGIAWLDSYCQTAASGGSYSFNKIFKFGSPNDTLPFDSLLVGHELGHNLGSDHTHCLDTSASSGLQPVDTCFSGESGCYAGATACPAGGQGTLMSYCNLGACGAGTQNSPRFGSFVTNLLLARIGANFPSCIQSNTNSADLIFRSGFE